MKKYAAIALLPLMLAGCGFEVVDTGERGVEIRYGEIIGDVLPEGLHFYNPFTSDVIALEVRTQRQDFETQAYTKDVQQALVRVTVNYNLRPESVVSVYKEVGRNWGEVLLPQVVTGTTKNIFGRWDAVELIENRAKATSEIGTALTQALSPRGVEITNFEITNIDFDDGFEKAVEAKVIATQRASESVNKTKQVEEEAKQKVIAAEAEARSMRIRSEALSQNKSLVEYEAVQKWNGILPTMMMGDSVPFINVGK